jgi:hypothetical protein
MTFKRVTSAVAGDATHFGGLDVNKFSDYLGGTDISASETVNIATPTLFSNYTDLGRISAPANPSTNQGRFYVKQIDSNNDGLFVKIKKGGSFVEVQII